MVKAKKITPTKKTKKDDSEEKFICCTCGHSYSVQKSNFRPSKSPRFAGNNGFLPICKGCLEKELKQYDNDYDSEYKAMRRICQAWDIYYNRDLHKVAKKGKGIDFLLGAYFSNLNFDQWGGGRKTYDDTIAEEDGSAISDAGDAESGKINNEITVTMKTIKFFGYGFSNSEYKQLSDQYEDWIKEYECKDKAQKELLKNMCIIQIQIQRALQKGDKLEQLMASFNTLLGSAKLKPSDSTNDSNDPNAVFGVWLSSIERHTPAEYYADKKKYFDFDGLKDYIDRFMYRPLKNLLTGSKDMDSECNLSADEDGDE